ncbi:unnamed protein product [Larinioides sclopetarius]|uniref:Smr domain-containing protein n=1 Tax=Larinioides sclopetarius TaxID=280406 RepID=A0AAV2AUC9_9ARAC
MKHIASLMLMINMGRGANTLDLHGLYTHEAVVAMQDFTYTFFKINKVLVLITGQGHHSLNGPRLRPTVINHLISHQFKPKSIV